MKIEDSMESVMTEPLFAKLRELQNKVNEGGWRMCGQVYNSDLEGRECLVGYAVTESIDAHELRQEIKNTLPKLFTALDLMEEALEVVTAYEDPKYMFSHQYAVAANALAKVREIEK